MIRIVLLFLCLYSFGSLRAQTPHKPSGGNWTKGPSQRFVGNVWVEYFKNDTTNDFISSRVLFEPWARSNWHKHRGIQVIFAVEGEGYYWEKDKPLKILRKGDVVVIDPETIHSHGSCGKVFVQSVVMNNSSRPDATSWLEPVKDEEIKKQLK